ncbi:hypothetical protein SSS_02827 [Sarcoptes scabiei]|uniref:KAT8 regulatory NSL complex subunit 2 n=1 Tax=Sarcoptes scabiei TaxID=52283 RepID=A0A834R7T7_SARSC|nr:hypothetical protein SSS_02827 [Sarcoptes scabiei]UXI17951.1 hypothetical protein NH340_JMT03894 [Sarcoptes scabiei]
MSSENSNGVTNSQSTSATKPLMTSSPINRIGTISAQNNRSGQQLIYLKRQSLNKTLLNHIITNRHQQNNNKADNYCLYLHRFCLQPRLEGSNYCIRHILFDRNAPYKQCSFVHLQTNRRCWNAARRIDRREKDTSYCQWHIKKFNLLRHKALQLESLKSNSSSFQANLPSESEVNSETDRQCLLKRKLEKLEHYCDSDEHDHRRKNADWDLVDKCTTASKSLKSQIKNSIVSQNFLIEKEDVKSVTLADSLVLDFQDLDNECVETYMDDPLRHSGVFSAEEIAHILRDKMLRLQTLYINMLTYYRYMLKNKMREYMLEKIQNENRLLAETNPSSVATIAPTNITNIDSLQEEEDYLVRKAMFRYHNRSGPEKLIQQRANSIRQSLIEDRKIISTFPICVYRKENFKCGEKCLPLSNYCKNHILYDPNQVLYRPCAKDEPPCLEPVVSYIHKNCCLKHKFLKFQSSDIEKIMSKPSRETIPEIVQKEETHDDDDEELTNLDASGPEFIHSIEDITLGMDSVEQENLFNLEQFDLDSNILS